MFTSILFTCLWALTCIRIGVSCSERSHMFICSLANKFTSLKIIQVQGITSFIHTYTWQAQGINQLVSLPLEHKSTVSREVLLSIYYGTIFPYLTSMPYQYGVVKARGLCSCSVWEEKRSVYFYSFHDTNNITITQHSTSFF